MHMSFEKIETYTGPEHRAPQDCRSSKGERCDICFAPMPEVKPDENSPAARAAKLVKEIHEQDNQTLPEIGNYEHKTD